MSKRVMAAIINDEKVGWVQVAHGPGIVDRSDEYDALRRPAAANCNSGDRWFVTLKLCVNKEGGDAAEEVFARCFVGTMADESARFDSSLRLAALAELEWAIATVERSLAGLLAAPETWRANRRADAAAIHAVAQKREAMGAPGMPVAGGYADSAAKPDEV